MKAPVHLHPSSSYSFNRTHCEGFQRRRSATQTPREKMPTSIKVIAVAAAAVESSNHNRTPPLSSGQHRATHELWIPDTIAPYHVHSSGPHQCSSSMAIVISAPVAAVWSIVRRFDRPQTYKHFIKSCEIVAGDGGVGSLREVRLVSGLPAIFSRERLEVLDDDRHVLCFCVVGGEHRLLGYRSVTSMHAIGDGGGEEEGTVVVESYAVDIPHGNTCEETKAFVETIVGCNLHSLLEVAENSCMI